MDVVAALADLQYGRITYPDLVKQFQAATFTLVPPVTGASWQEIFNKCEDPNEFDAPKAINSASYCKTITPEQAHELLGIYRQNLSK